MENKNIQLILPADLQFSNAIRSFISDILTLLQVKSLWNNRIVLMADEIFMNAVKYGSDQHNGHVYINLEIDKEKIILNIEDEGKGEKKIDPEELEKIIHNNSLDKTLIKTSGRGLALIVKNWADNVRFLHSDEGGLKISITKKLENIIEEILDPQNVSMYNNEDIDLIDFSSFDFNDSGIEHKIIDQISNSRKKAFIFDFKKVTYINSLIMGIIAKIYNTVEVKNQLLFLINVENKVLDVLKSVGLDQLISIAKNIEDIQKQLKK